MALCLIINIESVYYTKIEENDMSLHGFNGYAILSSDGKKHQLID
jgi:hypothetical protein